MNTILFNTKQENISKAGDLLREGKLVAFPTETVYGLGANALDEKAVKNIFIAKGRPADNPLIVHIADQKELPSLVQEIPEIVNKLSESFWPGALTLIFKKKNIIPNIISAGLDTVAIRIPSHHVALELIKQSKVPIAAPSANTSTKPSPTSYEHVLDDLNGKIDGIIKGEQCKIGIESTVLDITTVPPTLLRPGGISKEEIEKVIGEIQTTIKKNKEIIIAKSPGMKYKHYAPQAKVIIVEKKELQEKIDLEKGRVAVITSQKDILANKILTFKNNQELANKLFYYFRECDKKKIDTIIVEKIDETGLGLGVMNRIKKAAKE